MRKIVYFILLVALALTIVACGGGGDTGSGGGDAAAGEELFAQAIIGTQAGCISCHSLEAGQTIVGPSMAGIGSRGDAAYIRESILNPDAQLVDGFPAGTMPQVWGDELSDAQVDQLVAYLLTLK